MNGPAADDRLVRYLLGDVLPDAERDEIEERYFTDNSCFERILAAESRLVDSYMEGRLSNEDRGLFERNFLASARRRAKWEARKATALHARSPAGPASLAASFRGFLESLAPGTRVLLGALSLLIAAGVGALGWRYVDLRDRTSVLQSRLAALEKRAARPLGVAEFVLQPERLRSGGVDPLRVSADIRWVVLRVELPPLSSAWSSFAAVLATADGDEIWRQSGFSPTALSIEIDLPVSALTRGDYVLSVSGVARTGEMKLPSYQFRIDR